MGKVNRLCNRVEPFAALFWALGNVQYSTCQHLTLPAGPASLHRSTQSMSLYGLSLGQFSAKTRCPLPFSYLGILFIYACNHSQNINTWL